MAKRWENSGKFSEKLLKIKCSDKKWPQEKTASPLL